MIASLGLSSFAAAALVVFVVFAFTLTVFAFAATVFLERILLPFKESSCRFPMVPAPSISEWFVAYSSQRRRRQDRFGISRKHRRQVILTSLHADCNPLLASAACDEGTVSQPRRPNHPAENADVGNPADRDADKGQGRLRRVERAVPCARAAATLCRIAAPCIPPAPRRDCAGRAWAECILGNDLRVYVNRRDRLRSGSRRFSGEETT